MAYRTWTGKGLEEYSKCLGNIEYEQVGFINISGIYQKSNPFVEHKVAGYIYRIYDHNANCPHRKSLTSPGSATLRNGEAKGLVVMLAKDNKTGSFFFDDGRIDPTKVTIAHPGAAWIASNYKGEPETIGEQVMDDHQGSFHRDCCTLDKSSAMQPALSRDHIERFILPSVVTAYSSDIKAMDSRRGAYMEEETDLAANLSDLGVNFSGEVSSAETQGLTTGEGQAIVDAFKQSLGQNANVEFTFVSDTSDGAAPTEA